MAETVVAARLAAERRLHLACGKHILPGWANVDLQGPAPVIEWDLTRPLPCKSGSYDFIFSEHFIEHVTCAQGLSLLRDCHRILCPGGVLRLSTPSLEKLVSEYGAGRLEAWSDLGWKPQTSCQLLNQGMRLWGHQFLYDRPELLRAFASAGFQRVEEAEWRTSAHEEMRGLECRPFHDEIILEATK